MESRASAIMECDDRPLDLQKVMRSAVINAQDPKRSSSTARIRDCSPTPPNCGGRSSDIARRSFPAVVRASCIFSAPTHSSHVDKCASSADCIQVIEASSFGMDFRIWVSRGTAEQVSIFWD